MIFFQDLTWEIKMRKGFGKKIVAMCVYIHLECLIDFIDGQQCEEGGRVQYYFKKIGWQK
jgi:hypothetical protein